MGDFSSRFILINDVGDSSVRQFFFNYLHTLYLSLLHSVHNTAVSQRLENKQWTRPSPPDRADEIAPQITRTRTGRTGYDKLRGLLESGRSAGSESMECTITRLKPTRGQLRGPMAGGSVSFAQKTIAEETLNETRPSRTSCDGTNTVTESGLGEILTCPSPYLASQLSIHTCSFPDGKTDEKRIERGKKTILHERDSFFGYFHACLVRPFMRKCHPDRIFNLS